jgi:hypothetical protein
VSIRAHPTNATVPAATDPDTTQEMARSLAFLMLWHRPQPGSVVAWAWGFLLSGEYEQATYRADMSP